MNKSTSDYTQKYLDEILIEKISTVDKIKELKEKLEDLELSEYLLNLKIDCPKIVCSNDDMKKYKYISKPIHLKHLELSLYPLWIQVECTYPEWSNDFLSINLIDYNTYKKGKGYEHLIDGISNGLNCSYKYAQTLIRSENLSLPLTFIHKIFLGSNLQIDFSTGTKITEAIQSKYEYHFISTIDSNMLLNTVKIKYILILPSNYSLDI